MAVKLQRHSPAIELEDGTWYRDESKDMARLIRAGKLTTREGAHDGREAAPL
jgi:NADPH-dependent curcumin reductase CurA